MQQQVISDVVAVGSVAWFVGDCLAVLGERPLELTKLHAARPERVMDCAEALLARARQGRLQLLDEPLPGKRRSVLRVAVQQRGDLVEESIGSLFGDGHASRLVPPSRYRLRALP